jgi:hypothetical protein
VDVQFGTDFFTSDNDNNRFSTVFFQFIAGHVRSMDGLSLW